MVYLVLAAILWGSSFPVVTYALGDISPILFVVLRFSIAFVVLLPPFVRAGRWRHLFHRDLILLSIPNALSFILQFKAQELTTASKTALFVNSSPVFVALLSPILFKERLSARQFVAMVLALAGVVITSTRLDFADLTKINMGDVLAVMVGICWAVFIVFSRSAVRRFGSLHLSQALYFWTAIMALPFMAFEPTRFAWRSVPAILYLAFFTTLLAYYLYMKGVRTVSSLSTSIIILIEVVVAFVISYFFLGESFSTVETVGVVMVMAGVVLVLRE